MTGDPSRNSPAGKVRLAQARPLPKRFYTDVAVAPRGGGHAVHLDGRPLRTPGKLVLVLPTAAMAEAVAAEWAAQAAHIDPTTMPLTRLVNSVRDQVEGREAEVRADIVKYAGSDLVCYRADAPAALVDAQAKAWDPAVAWAREALGADLAVCRGLMPVAQSAASRVAIEAAVAGFDAFRLAAAHVMTTVLGSIVLTLAMLRGHMTPEAAWNAAHVDEDWQIGQWGADEEAARRREHRRSEFMAAVRLDRLAAGADSGS